MPALPPVPLQLLPRKISFQLKTESAHEQNVEDCFHGGAVMVTARYRDVLSDTFFVFKKIWLKRLGYENTEFIMVW